MMLYVILYFICYLLVISIGIIIGISIYNNYLSSIDFCKLDKYTFKDDNDFLYKYKKINL